MATARQMTFTQLDSLALYDALDEQRVKRALSWRSLAGELGIAPSFFTRLKTGLVPDTKTLFRVCDWLGARIDDFRVAEGERVPRRARLTMDDLAPAMSAAQIAAIDAEVFGDE